MATSSGHCADHVDVVKMVKEIHVALLGHADPEGHEGLVAKVRRHDVALKSVQRMAWVVLTGALGTVVAMWVRCGVF